MNGKSSMLEPIMGRETEEAPSVVGQALFASTCWSFAVAAKSRPPLQRPEPRKGAVAPAVLVAKPLYSVPGRLRFQA